MQTYKTVQTVKEQDERQQQSHTTDSWDDNDN